MDTLAIIWFLGVFIAACTVNPTSNDSFCSNARPIYFSNIDKVSDDTAKEIAGHNDTGKKLCGWSSAQ